MGSSQSRSADETTEEESRRGFEGEVSGDDFRKRPQEVSEKSVPMTQGFRRRRLGEGCPEEESWRGGLGTEAWMKRFGRDPKQKEVRRRKLRGRSETDVLRMRLGGPSRAEALQKPFGEGSLEEVRTVGRKASAPSFRSKRKGAISVAICRRRSLSEFRTKRRTRPEEKA